MSESLVVDKQTRDLINRLNKADNDILKIKASLNKLSNRSTSLVATGSTGAEPSNSHAALEGVQGNGPTHLSDDEVSHFGFFNSTFAEQFDFTTASDGFVITGSLEKTGTGDLTMRFADSEFVVSVCYDVVVIYRLVGFPMYCTLCSVNFLYFSFCNMKDKNPGCLGASGYSFLNVSNKFSALPKTSLSKRIYSLSNLVGYPSSLRSSKFREFFIFSAYKSRNFLRFGLSQSSNSTSAITILSSVQIR